MAWFVDEAGFTYEQVEPYGELEAVYDPDGWLVPSGWWVSWDQVEGLRPDPQGGAW